MSFQAVRGFFSFSFSGEGLSIQHRIGARGERAAFALVSSLLIKGGRAVDRVRTHNCLLRREWEGGKGSAENAGRMQNLWQRPRCSANQRPKKGRKRRRLRNARSLQLTKRGSRLGCGALTRSVALLSLFLKGERSQSPRAEPSWQRWPC